MWCDGKRGNVQKEGCKFESHVWHVDKKFVSFNCVLYRIVILFCCKGTHVLCYNRSGSTLFWCKETHVLCYYISNSNIFLDIKEHISCVTIDHTVLTLTIGTLTNMCY